MIVGAAGLLLTSRQAVSAEDVGITGGGSSFVKPVLQNWTKMVPKSLDLKAS